MSDLLGAGLGALLAVPLLNSFGAINTIFLAALAFAIAAFYFAGQWRRQRLVAYACGGLCAFIFAVNARAQFLDINMAALPAEKPIVAELAAGGEILATRWDAFARSDLVAPANGAPLRLYVDGGAASIMPPAARSELLRDIGFFPFATEQPQTVFILGPGAGLDVFFALQGQAEQITAVEVNPASIELVEAWRAYTGGLYDQPAVEIIVDDGRAGLRRSAKKYDLIYLSQVVTLAAERGGYALSENTVYTAEAFADYLAQLSDGGQIALKLYDEVTLTRALSTALAALRQRGLSDQQALQHLMAFVDEKSQPPLPLLLIGNQAFSEDDSLVLGAIARDVGFKPLLLPQVLVEPALAAVASGEQSFAAIIEAAAADIRPPTDDRPYFFQFERGIPAALMPLTIIAALLSAFLLALWLYHLRRARANPQRYMPALAACLGIGFIASEIYAIQQSRLFLGHPTLALTVVLATFLLGGGIGSGLSQRPFAKVLRRRPQLATALIVALLFAWSILLPPISRELVAASLTVRLVVVVLSLLPLALCLGMPFPQALAYIGGIERRQVAVAWSVNGIMTVVGTVAAVLLSIMSGFSAVLLFGGGAYVLATICLLLMQRGGDK